VLSGTNRSKASGSSAVRSIIDVGHRRAEACHGGVGRAVSGIVLGLTHSRPLLPRRPAEVTERALHGIE